MPAGTVVERWHVLEPVVTLVVGAGIWVLQTGGVRPSRKKRETARQARRLSQQLTK